MVDKQDFATTICPHDCPFRDKLDRGLKYCSFAIYANQLEPGRIARTEVIDGEPNYHIPPDCDVYERYKDRREEIQQMKDKYDQYGIRRTPARNPELYVTGIKHRPVEHHRRND